MTDKWEVKINDAVARFGRKIFILRKNYKGEVEIYNPITEEIKPYIYGQEPEIGLFLDEEMLDALFVELQKRGYKPKEQSFVEGQFESQTKHLEDMRKLLKLK